MSFDFGDSKQSDPTSDFVSKFPDLDADDADAALHSAAGAGGSSSNNLPAGLDGFGDDDDLLGGGGGGPANEGPTSATAQQPRDERSQFESQFPELDDPDLNTPIDAQPTSSNGFGDGGIGGFSSQQQQNQYSAPPSAAVPAPAQASEPYHHDVSDDEEPEPIRKWRHEQAESIARRSATAEREKAEAISKAERDIDEFYKEYNAKKEKNIKKNKEDEAAFAEKRQRELAEGTTWDRITRLIDLQNSQSKTIAPVAPGSTDLSRYREILLSLRREGDTAPAAGGY